MNSRALFLQNEGGGGEAHKNENGAAEKRYNKIVAIFFLQTHRSAFALSPAVGKKQLGGIVVLGGVLFSSPG